MARSDYAVRDQIPSREVNYKGKALLRSLSFGLGVATTFTGALSAYFLAYYESLGPQVLIRNRPEFVQSVTYPAIFACALGIVCCASYLAAKGKVTRAWWSVAWGCFGLLSFYALWSSRAFLELLSPFMAQPYLFSLQSYGFGFGIYGNLPVDLISVMLVVVICSAVFFVYRGERLVTRILKVIQLGSLSVIPIPVYILLFDTSEFNLHVTSFQVHYGLLRWFTNADLFVIASLVFLGSTVLLSQKRFPSGSP